MHLGSRDSRAAELLVIHGDEFDTAVKCSRWLARCGAHAYDFTLRLNRYLNACRGLLGLPYWSFATYLKLRHKNAVMYVVAFEAAAAQAARQRGLDGIVCGHIHRADVSDIDGVLNCNDGDWVESCTALVEENGGQLSLWHALQVRRRLANWWKPPPESVARAGLDANPPRLTPCQSIDGETRRHCTAIVVK